MGRELKRVQLDFDWPLNKTWDGYLNPLRRPCPRDDIDCFGGWTAAAKWLNAIAQLIALAGDDAARPGRRGIYPHPRLQEWTMAPRTSNGHLAPLTDELAQLVAGLNGAPLSTAYKIEDALKTAAGVADDWGTCPVCAGYGVDPAVREAWEAWEPTEPPTGDGYQLWETTSEGSPVSPVFTTLDALCEWCATNATTFGSFKATAGEWRKMLDDGFVHHAEGNVVFM